MDLAAYMNNVRSKIETLNDCDKNVILYHVCDLLLNSNKEDSDLLDEVLLYLDLKGITADLKG